MAELRRPVHARGWLDTTARVREALAADPYISALFSRNARLGTLRTESTDIISAAITICCGVRYLADDRAVPSREYILALTIGELMSPVLPVDMCLDVEAATRVFISILDTLLVKPNQYTRRHSVAEWLTQLQEAAVAEIVPDQPGDEEDQDEGDDPRVHINELRRTLTEEHIDEVSVDDKIAFLIWLASKLPTNMYLETVVLIVTSYVGIAKRGTISEKFITKIQNGMTTDVGVNVELSSEVIQQAYNVFGRFVTATNAPVVFERWLADIPEHALRLRLTLTQVTGSGLTAFMIIGRAMSKYETFQWAKLNVLTQGELTCFQNALRVVNGNAYYGFNRDLGAARSTLYSSIAYVGKELLIRINGETSLKGYQGWIRKPKSATVIDNMIADYVNRRTAEMEAAEAPEADVVVQQSIHDALRIGNNVQMFG